MWKLILTLSLVTISFGFPRKENKIPRFHTGRIVGGEEAQIENYPHQVSFRYYDEHICGGSIIDETTVLTAAHCTDELSVTRMSVMVGSDQVEGGQVHDVLYFIQHPLFNDRTFDYDVTILKLASSIEFNSKTQPITLQDDGDDVQAGTVATVTGWGATFEGDEETPVNLRKVDIDVISVDACRDMYGQTRITDRMLCGFRSGKDSCQGDSGGPLVANGKLIGVVSWGIGCARPNYAGIYSKVSNLRRWIDMNK